MQGTEPSASRVGVRDFDWSLNAIKRAFPLVAWLRSVPGGTRLAQFPRPSEWQPNHAFVHGPTALLPTSRPPQPVVVLRTLLRVVMVTTIASESTRRTRAPGSMLHRVARGNGAQPASGRLHRDPSSRARTRKKPVDVRETVEPSIKQRDRPR
jgi:hypothetical protein